MTTTLAISGMTCNHCVQHVTRALKGVPGVAEVAIDLSAGRAQVTHGDATGVAALVSAVRAAGYTAAEAARA